MLAKSRLLLPHQGKVWCFGTEWVPSLPALGLIYTVKEGFLNGFSLSPCAGFFFLVLKMCGLMLRCKSLSVEKCVMEPGHPMNTILFTESRMPSVCGSAFPRRQVTMVIPGAWLSKGFLVLFDLREAQRVASEFDGTY